MKKQKLIEKINKIAIETPFLKSKIVDHLEVIKLIEQLDEPEKVKVPQFVADFITEQKKLGYTLSCSIDASMSDRVAEWYWNNFGLFASAWLDGYEVEKEKRYLVKIKGDIKENTLVYGENLERYFFTKNFTLGDAIYYHTRKELEEAGFGWVFSCEGIEIEEVE